MSGEIATAIIIVLLVLLCIFSVKSYLKKLQGGCCGAGGGPGEKKVKVADRNADHYPYQAVAVIDGMVCGNCATRVENALNSMDGVWAKVDLSKKQAAIRSKMPLEEQEVRSTVRKLGYTVMKFERA